MEYWADQSRKLELSIQLLLQYKQWRGEHPFDPMHGLIITEQEVVFLLNGSAAEAPQLPEELVEAAERIRSWNVYTEQRVQLSLRTGTELPVYTLAQRFQLSSLEVKLLVIAMANELDRKFEKLFGYLNDDVTSKAPTFDLAMQLASLDDAEPDREAALDLLCATSPNAPLSRFLLEPREDGSGAIRTRPIRLEERIVRYLLHGEREDGMLQGVVASSFPDEPVPHLLAGEELQHQLYEYAAEMRRIGEPLWLHLFGMRGAGKKLQLQHLAKQLRLPLLVVQAEALGTDLKRGRALIGRIVREARLMQGLLAVDCGDQWEKLQEESPWLTAEWMEGLQQPLAGVCWLSEEELKLPALPYPQGSITISVHCMPPDTAKSIQLWQHWTSDQEWEPAMDWEAVADIYRFTPGQIKGAISQADKQAKWEGSAQIQMKHLQAGALAQTNHKLEKKARKLNPRYTFEDLILPEEQLEMLKQAYYQMKYRGKVYREWGFDRKLSYGKGLSMLFAGPPGTGKTMAAEVVANALKLEVYKIDLSQIISKYIGETEKNLHEIYNEAGRSHAVLFFDESDALFGKRSEVKDAHDKYANVETAYLLQKMEEYDGVSILATNFQQNIDEAFMRRLNLVVKFPFPDAAHREKIWRFMIPAETPVEADIDYAFLANKLEVAGGNIKNIVLTAAFLAAAEGSALAMRHLIAASRQELRKTGKILVNEDWGGYY